MPLRLTIVNRARRAFTLTNRSFRLTFVNRDRYSGGVEDPPRDTRIPDIVGLQEAAEIMGVSKQAAHKMVRKAQLKGARVGNSTTWVFRRSVVEAMPKHPKADEQ